MQIEIEEKPTPQEAWEMTKSRLSEKRPNKMAWLRLGTLKKFHEGLFIVEFPASAMNDARKLSHEMLVHLNQSINRELTRLMDEDSEILSEFSAM
jgi:hypothetical protein